MNYRNNYADEASLDGGVKDIIENSRENGKEKIFNSVSILNINRDISNFWIRIDGKSQEEDDYIIIWLIDEQMGGSEW